MSSNLIQLTDDNFEEEIINAKKPALIDFWATWCNPCQMIAPIIAEIADEYESKLIVGKLDVEDNHLISSKYNIRSIPTLLIIIDGEVKDSLVGAIPKEKLKNIIDNYI